MNKMDTAPRDGTPFLVDLEGHGIDGYCWWAGKGARDDAGITIYGWYGYRLDDPKYDHRLVPNGWLPLPSGDGWTKIEGELNASREWEKKLADKLKRSLDAWSNILDLGLVPENYRPDVRVVIERIDRALAAHREAGE